MAAPVNDNPWSAEGWNLTAQSIYTNTYGLARARARAGDAGTYLGAPAPPGARKYLKADYTFTRIIED